MFLQRTASLPSEKDELYFSSFSKFLNVVLLKFFFGEGTPLFFGRAKKVPKKFNNVNVYIVNNNVNVYIVKFFENLTM